MNKYRYQSLVLLMSISFLGIILVQAFWIKTSYVNKEKQFQYTISQVLNNLSKKSQAKEKYDFYKNIEAYKKATGKTPNKTDIKEIFYIERDLITNDQIIYSNKISLENYEINQPFIDNNRSSKVSNYSSHSRTEVYKEDQKLDQGTTISSRKIPDEVIEKETDLDIGLELAYYDVVGVYPIEKRINTHDLNEALQIELKQQGIETPYEFAIFSNGLSTSIASKNYAYNEKNTYSVLLFPDMDNFSKHKLFVSFPNKSTYLYADLLPFVLISMLFIAVIMVAYYSAISQLNNLRQVSEIKNDFINNMTHEFKTPIATINLALDAIKNPKIITDQEKILKYAAMIKEENKRMHAQIENILRMSKLERKELDIPKEKMEIHELIEDAMARVALQIEDRNGDLSFEFNASRDTVLVNPTHFTNVITNVLDNAIKYSPDELKIEVSTENIKDFILIKIKDYGQGISKQAQKRIFEKFYRENTGDLHNVKGHGLGLSYLKQIIEDHNGQVFVESEKGKGTTFFIKLPLIN